MTRDELLDLFRRSGALLEGHFRLTSGLHSSGYLQCALVLQHPDHAGALGRERGDLRERPLEVLLDIVAEGLERRHVDDAHLVWQRPGQPLVQQVVEPDDLVAAARRYVQDLAANVSPASLADTVGVVSQETYLFHATVRENLRFARPTATDDEIEEAARAAQIHELIATLPDGYETMVGERGTTLMSA